MAQRSEGKTKRSGPITSEQKQILINFINNYPQLKSGKFTQKFTVKDSQNLWQQVTVELNAVPGAQKSWQKWRKTWQDLKNSSKAKGAAINRYKNRTGGGPPLLPKDELDPQEEQILDILGKSAVEGHQGVLESSASFQFNNLNDVHVEEFPSNNDNISEDIVSTSEGIKDLKGDTFKSNETNANLVDKSKEIRCYDKENKNYSHKVQLKKKNPEIRVQRLKTSINAMETLLQQNDNNTKIRREYYQRKLKLMKSDIDVKRKICIALEVIAKKL